MCSDWQQNTEWPICLNTVCIDHAFHIRSDKIDGFTDALGNLLQNLMSCSVVGGVLAETKCDRQ